MINAKRLMRITLVFVIAVAALATIVPLRAQTPDLALADWNDFNQDVYAKALITSGHESQSGGTTLFNSSSNWSSVGTLEDGELDLTATGSISRIQYHASYMGSTGVLRFNDNSDPLHLGDWFTRRLDIGPLPNPGLHIYIKTATAEVSFYTNGSNGQMSQGHHWVNFDPPASVDAVLSGIAAGDKFIIAVAQLANGDGDLDDTPRAATVLSGSVAPAAQVVNDSLDRATGDWIDWYTFTTTA